MRISDWSSDVCSSDLDQAVSRVILCLPGGFLCGAQRFDELQIVFTKFSEHVLRRHIFSVVVLNGLTPRYVANRPKRRVAGLADSLSDENSRGQNLRGMIIQNQVIVGKMRSEARRVGKEGGRMGRCRWGGDVKKKKI